MSRADEIAQGLRDPGGALTFPLHVLDYTQGHLDFANGDAAPRLSSPSYDLGRARAARLADEEAEILAKIRADSTESRRRMRLVLADHPEALAEYDARLADLDRAHNAHSDGGER